MRSGTIINLKSQAPAGELGADAAALLLPIGLKVWRGASGRAYLHVIYNLVGCPQFAHGSYRLISRSPVTGQRIVLAQGRSCRQEPSLNLAHVRRQGAELGATEVHLLETTNHCDAVAADIDLASQLAAPGATTGTPNPAAS